jgi:large subunit ribosomal protein L23
MSETSTKPRGATLSAERVYQIILAPVVTEKATRLNETSQVTFKVTLDATKPEIKAAVEKLFNVKVEKVAVQNRVGKMRRSRMRRTSTKAWKKAVVTLKPDSKINLF